MKHSHPTTTVDIFQDNLDTLDVDSGGGVGSPDSCCILDPIDYKGKYTLTYNKVGWGGPYFVIFYFILLRYFFLTRLEEDTCYLFFCFNLMIRTIRFKQTYGPALTAKKVLSEEKRGGKGCGFSGLFIWGEVG